MSPAASFLTRPVVELLGRHQGYGFAGIGVSTAIGNFTQTTADLTFGPGLLGLLNWQRTYNSHSGAIGALGPGWTTSFSARLVAPPPEGLLHHTASPVTFFDEDGRVLTFTPAASGGFTRPQDLAADLTRNADGSFTLTYNCGAVWSFDATGRLTGRSLEGQQVSLDYDGNDLLVRAEHSSGRSLAFSYDANRRLTSVQASDGRVVSFGYGAGTVADSLLESVTVPGGGVITFESSGSGQAAQVSKITDPDGDLVVANVYDSTTAEVTSQQYGGGGSAAFSYNTTGGTTVTSEPGGAQVVFQADANGRMVKVTDAGGNTATFGYDGNGYLAQGTTPGGTALTQIHDAQGNLLNSTFDGSTTAWTYDSADRVTSVTGPTGDRTSFAYTGGSRIPSQVTNANGGLIQAVISNGLVTTRTNADGGTTSYGYDAALNLTSVTGPLGEQVQLAYDAAGYLTKSVAPSGATRQWARDDANRVTSYTAQDGTVIEFRYSAAGQLVERIDPGGASIRYGYGAAGNRISITDALGNQATFGYDALGNLVTSTNAAGDIVTYAYNALGQLITVTDPVDAVAEFHYDADGNNVTTITPAGTFTATYDGRGNNTSLTDPADSTLHFGYDAASRLTSLTDPLNGSWQVGYDGIGNMTSVSDPNGTTARLAWTGTGRLASTIDALGRKITYGYDAGGHLTEVTNAQGGTIRYAYDADGRRISATSPAGLQTQYAYDATGRVVASTDPRGWVTRAVYNARHQRIAVISPSGLVTKFGYDAAGHLTEVTDGNGATTQYGYDSAGRLISITDPKGAVTGYGYDKAGHLISETDPLGRTTTRAYDKAGNLITITDPSGQTQDMTYDADGRLLQWTAEGTPTVSFSYDKAGRRTSMTDATGTTHYTYDANGHLLTITGPDGQMIKATYDAAGQRTSLAYPGGLTVGYVYNANGRLIAMQDSRAGDAAFAVDPDGRLITEQLPGRLARRYHYEGGLLHRFAVIEDDRLAAETTLARDPDGRIVTQADHDGVREFRYDRAGQLVFSGLRDVPRDDLHLTYDASGNRVSLRRGDVETHYAYDAADQLTGLEARGRRVQFRCDSSGRLIEEVDSERRRVVSYNGFGWPVSVTETERDLSEVIQATYDGDGQVAELVLTSTDQGRDEQRAASVRYRWSSGDLIPQILTQRARPDLDDAEHDRPGPLDADFSYGYARTFGSSEHTAAAFHHDAYESQIRTEDTADWAQAEHYDAFGVPTGREAGEEHENRGHPPAPRPHDFQQRQPTVHGEAGRPRVPLLPRFGYRGELALGPALDLRARVYDAELGRFTTRDPLLTGAPRPGQPANPYLYANNDPVNFADPLGTLAIAPTAGGQVGILARAGQVGQPTSATAHLANTTSMLAAGATGDLTTLHTAATYVASFELADQLEPLHGLPDRVEYEEQIPAAPKSRLRRGQDPGGPSYGKADILFAYFPLGGGEDVYVWEVKSAISTTIPAATRLAETEAEWYVDAYNQNFLAAGSLFSLAEEGEPMQTQAYVEVPGFDNITVFSPPESLGAVIYDLGQATPPPPPVPVFEYQPQERSLTLKSGPQLSAVGLNAGRIALEAAGITAAGILGTAAVVGTAGAVAGILEALGELALAF